MKYLCERGTIMKMGSGSGFIQMLLCLVTGMPALANKQNALYIAWCAAALGEKHAIGHIRMMAAGVSRCAQTAAPCTVLN